MNSYYKDFLKRLIQYRIQLNMTQEKISRELGITQSQFSKQELGKTIVPYKILIKFKNMGWDIDYLFTGKKAGGKSSELSSWLNEIGPSNRQTMLKLAVWALETGIAQNNSEIAIETKCEIDILKAKTDSEVEQSILYEIRKSAGIQQILMAEKLGVNIKKYRALERAETLPDAELLLEIYGLTGCKPSLFLVSCDVASVIIDDLWGLLSINQQRKILDIMEQAKEFLGA